MQNDINIHSVTSLLQATNLTPKMVKDYLSLHRERLFEVKSLAEIQDELAKIRTARQSIEVSLVDASQAFTDMSVLNPEQLHQHQE